MPDDEATQHVSSAAEEAREPVSDASGVVDLNSRLDKSGQQQNWSGGHELRTGVLLGIVAAVGYSGANLALRQLAIPNDPGWAVWVTANKAIPAALIAWLMIFVQWSRGQPGLPPVRMIGRLILVGLFMQYGGNFMFQRVTGRRSSVRAS